MGRQQLVNHNTVPLPLEFAAWCVLTRLAEFEKLPAAV